MSLHNNTINQTNHRSPSSSRAVMKRDRFNCCSSVLTNWSPVTTAASHTPFVHRRPLRDGVPQEIKQYVASRVWG